MKTGPRVRAVIITIVLTLIVGAVVMIITANAITQPMRVDYAVSLDYGVRDEQFRRDLRHFLGQPITPGNRIELLQNGEEIFPALLAAIEQAVETVSLETYEFGDGEVPQAFVRTLVEAAQRGVTIHVILDWLGSVQASQADLEYMQNAGVQLVRWRRPAWYQLARFNYRTHRADAGSRSTS